MAIVNYQNSDILYTNYELSFIDILTIECTKKRISSDHFSEKMGLKSWWEWKSRGQKIHVDQAPSLLRIHWCPIGVQHEWHNCALSPRRLETQGWLAQRFATQDGWLLTGWFWTSEKWHFFFQDFCDLGKMILRWCYSSCEKPQVNFS